MKITKTFWIWLLTQFFYFRIKHIQIHYHAIWNYVEKREIKIQYISTTDMLADSLIKSLNQMKFERMIKELDLTNWLSNDVKKYIEFFLYFFMSFSIEWERVLRSRFLDFNVAVWISRVSELWLCSDLLSDSHIVQQTSTSKPLLKPSRQWWKKIHLLVEEFAYIRRSNSSVAMSVAMLVLVIIHNIIFVLLSSFLAVAITKVLLKISLADLNCPYIFRCVFPLA